MEDIPSNGWRLLKANLAVNTQPDKEQSTWASHPVETLVAAQFLELVERESARRIVVHRGGKTGLLVSSLLFVPRREANHLALDLQP